MFIKWNQALRSRRGKKKTHCFRSLSNNRNTRRSTVTFEVDCSFISKYLPALRSYTQINKRELRKRLIRVNTGVTTWGTNFEFQLLGVNLLLIVAAYALGVNDGLMIAVES